MGTDYVIRKVILKSEKSGYEDYRGTTEIQKKQHGIVARLSKDQLHKLLYMCNP